VRTLLDYFPQPFTMAADFMLKHVNSKEAHHSSFPAPRPFEAGKTQTAARATN
jgi:hypothetical protein